MRDDYGWYILLGVSLIVIGLVAILLPPGNLPPSEPVPDWNSYGKQGSYDCLGFTELGLRYACGTDLLRDFPRHYNANLNIINAKIAQLEKERW